MVVLRPVDNYEAVMELRGGSHVKMHAGELLPEHFCLKLKIWFDRLVRRKDFNG